MSPFEPDNPATRPAKIHADRSAGTLAIEWLDGHASLFDAVTLRWLCPCAYCRGEAGLPGWLDSAPKLTPEQTRIATVSLVGSYALAPAWGDGHATGFYTWTMLRDHCPCEACRQQRSSAPASAPAPARPEAQP